MFLSYLKLSLRLMARNPFLSLINITGLSIGFAAFYILYPFAQSELNTDQFYPDHENIARLARRSVYIDGKRDRSVYIASHNAGIALQFKNEYEEITNLTRVFPQEVFETFRQGFDKDVFISIAKGSTKEFFREKKIAYGDPNFFTFFPFPILEGDARTFLSAPNTVVLSEKTALKFFGKTSLLNKTIHLNDTIPLTVTGVFKNLPPNSHFNFEMLISTVDIKALSLTGWITTWFGSSYIKVKKGTDFTALQNKINFRSREIYGVCPNCPENNYTTAYLQPLKEVAFTNLRGENFPPKSKQLLMALYALSFILLLLAWINYACLSVHQLKKRFPEIGTRRIVGAERKDLLFQFMVDTILVNTISVLLGLTLVQLLEARFAEWLGFYIVSWHSLTVQSIGIMVTLFMVGIGITSLYPVIIFTNKQALHFFNKQRSDNSFSWMNTVVTVQYVSAIVLVVWMVAVYLQMNLILNKSIGFNKEGIVIIDCPLEQKNDFQTKLNSLLNRIVALNSVINASVSKSVVGDYAGYGIPLQLNKKEIEWGLDTNGGVDEYFLNTYGIKLLHGRNFNREMPSDKSAILLSKAAALRMGFSKPEDALGSKLILPWFGHDQVEVIGIYQDYEFRPFLSSVFENNRGSFISYKDYLIPEFYPSKISVRMNLSNAKEGIMELEKLFKDIFPYEVFRYSFLDENIQQHYQGDKTARNQIAVFTLIAISIACLGLLGMISNKTLEKTKEIGIRKVLGAKRYQIAQILLNATVKQIMMATTIGTPVAWYLTQQYLQKFSEQIKLEWWHFALPVVMLVLIMFATVASVLWKAARGNPVEALKYE